MREDPEPESEESEVGTRSPRSSPRKKVKASNELYSPVSSII